ncbi:outer membrane lipoprotein chaperone LolA [Oceanisphaera arctica]|uniref:Outer-membrane lipoprotein carrier protein n=1 Tax=Oceanisphaera arctica TaxID=641510 RepID=A0A2P5TRK3_9GAMM|nr:outer membrane lipoprotein chaperone LolA [Oceanisphaera arctica]PPL18459.1 outer membrane lipoprotein carrier protein LolA [Oceanisphaera arctica]GHA24695.1 outer-membrane lipoprotein carrier protein [Oceanisphaera arctica]
MKKLATLGILLWSVSAVALADARAELQQKLASFDRFSARFSQQVFDEQGAPMQSAEGTMQLARPDRFRWHTVSPDESLIVSNGNDVWVYDPFVEQVSIAPLEQAIQNTPFLLIAGGDGRRWQQYDVARKGADYVVTSKDPGELISQFSLSFDRNNRIKRFTVIESGGQRSEFTLKQVNTKPATGADTFTFTPPAGVMVDDQR